MKSELIGISTLSDRFHTYCEQLIGVNPATKLQSSKQPRAQNLFPLSYLRIFSNPEANPTQIESLAGLMHLSMLCAGYDVDIATVTGWPHGLRCLQSTVIRRGIASVVFSGDGLQWRSALLSANGGPPEVQEWGQSCYQQFISHDLSELFQKNSNSLQIPLDN